MMNSTRSWHFGRHLWGRRRRRYCEPHWGLWTLRQCQLQWADNVFQSELVLDTSLLSGTLNKSREDSGDSRSSVYSHSHRLQNLYSLSLSSNILCASLSPLICCLWYFDRRLGNFRYTGRGSHLWPTTKILESSNAGSLQQLWHRFPHFGDVWNHPWRDATHSAGLHDSRFASVAAKQNHLAVHFSFGRNVCLHCNTKLLRPVVYELG